MAASVVGAVAALNDVVHQRVRLAILAFLYDANECDFSRLLTASNQTAGNLSRHLMTLEIAGLVRIDKGYDGRRARTSISISAEGREAYLHELSVLQTLCKKQLP